MIRKLILFSIVFSGGLVFAQEATDNDFSRNTDLKRDLSSEDLRKMVEVSGEIFVSDKNGRLRYQLEESRLWRFGKKADIVSNWNMRSPELNEIALKHTWSLDNSGKINVKIQQFQSMNKKSSGREVETGKLLREESLELKDFSPITWVAEQNDQRRVVVRFIPSLRGMIKSIEASDLPITLVDPLVYDNKGKLWVDLKDRTLEGKYLGITSHLGQLALSYLPFKGAKEVGYVSNNQIVIKVGEDTIFIRSQKSISPSAQNIKIYGLLNPSRKTGSFNSVQTSSADTEKELLDHL